MALPKIPKIGSMRARMLSVKSAPTIKLAGVKTTTGPKLKNVPKLEGSPMTRGEMM